MAVAIHVHEVAQLDLVVSLVLFENAKRIVTAMSRERRLPAPLGLGGGDLWVGERHSADRFQEIW